MESGPLLLCRGVSRTQGRAAQGLGLQEGKRCGPLQTGTGVGCYPVLRREHER